MPKLTQEEQLQKGIKEFGSRQQTQQAAIFREWFDDVPSKLFPEFIKQCREEKLNRLQSLDKLLKHLKAS